MLAQPVHTRLQDNSRFGRPAVSGLRRGPPAPGSAFHHWVSGLFVFFCGSAAKPGRPGGPPHKEVLTLEDVESERELLGAGGSGPFFNEAPSKGSLSLVPVIDPGGKNCAFVSSFGDL